MREELNRMDGRVVPLRPRQQASRSSLAAASAWMVGLTLLLFFVPFFNGLIGGMVGGYKAGTVKRGLLAALLPAAVVALGLWMLFAIFGAPVIGLVASAATGILVVFADVGMLAGGAIGGALRQTRPRARLPA